MPVLEKLGVFIEKSATRNERYEDLDDDTTDDESTVRCIKQYIEVEANQYFAIVIETQPGFQWHGANGIAAGFDFDEGAVINEYEVVVSKDEIRNAHVPAMEHNPTTIGLQYRIDYATLKHTSEDAEVYQKYLFRFQELQEDNLDTKLTPSSLQHHGEIRVVVKTINIEYRHRSRTPPLGAPVNANRPLKTLLEAKGFDLEIGLVDSGSSRSQHKVNFTTRGGRQIGIFLFRYRRAGSIRGLVSREFVSDVFVGGPHESCGRQQSTCRTRGSKSSPQNHSEVQDNAIATPIQAPEDHEDVSPRRSSTRRLTSAHFARTTTSAKISSQPFKDQEDTILVEARSGGHSVLENHNDESDGLPSSDGEEEFTEIEIETRGIRDRLDQARREAQEDLREFKAKKEELQVMLEREEALREEQRDRHYEELAALEVELTAVKTRNEGEKTRMDRSMAEKQEELAQMEGRNELDIERYNLRAEALDTKLAQLQQKRHDRKRRFTAAQAGVSPYRERPADSEDE